MRQGLLADLFRFLRRASTVHEGQGLSDGDLLERFLSRREEAAFEILMQRHGPMVLGVCQRIAGDAHAAEDAFQATFLVLARRAASIRKQASVGSWLHGVAKRIASKAKAQAAARRDRERRAADMPRIEPLDEVTWQELRTVLDEELGRLPEKYRAAVVLCYLEGKTYEQAARELGWQKSSLASRLAKACELLRGQLARRGLALSSAALAAVLTEKAWAAPVAALLTLNLMKAAASVVTGKPLAEGCLSAKAIALAEEAMKNTIGITGKWIVVLAVLGLAVGAGLAGHRAWVAQVPPQPDEKQPLAPKDDAPKKEAPPAVALDQYGEALPDGALARLVTAGLRHPGARQVIFSPDGKTLLSTGADRVVRRWEVASGKFLGAQPYATDKREYGDVTDKREYGGLSASDPYLSPDGKTVAVMGQKHLYFFDAATGKELHRVPQDFGALGDQTGGLLDGGQSRSGAAFTADGKQFGVLLRTGAFLLFDVATGKAIDTGLPEKLGKRGGFVHAALDPNGKQLATYIPYDPRSPKEGVTLWDLSSGKVLHTIHFPDPPATSRGAPRGWCTRPRVIASS